MRSRCVPKKWDKRIYFTEEKYDKWINDKVKNSDISSRMNTNRSIYDYDDRVKMKEYFSYKLVPRDMEMVKAGDFISNYLHFNHDEDGDISYGIIDGEGYILEEHSPYVIKQIKRMEYWFNTAMEGELIYKTNGFEVD